MRASSKASWVAAIVAGLLLGGAGCAGRTQRVATESPGAPALASGQPAAAAVAVRPAPMITEDAPLPSPSPRSEGARPRSYRIGEDDELSISVYGESDLSKTQSVRPDGKIAFPLVGDIEASGLTPDELRGQLTQKLARFVRNPRVTVIVESYKSKRVSVLGEVKHPGIVPLTAKTSLLEGISKAGGVTENADLEGAMLVRQGHVMPVDFEKLLRGGEVAQNNLPLDPADVILIPNVAAKKVFVLGEVQRPLVAALKYRTSLVEVIAMAGGFTRDAEKKNVLVVRGGLGTPKIVKINVDAITNEGELDQNLPLQPGDIVYAPRTLVADVDRFFQHISTWLQPIVLAETGIFLGPDVYSVLTTGETTTNTAVSVNPQ